ncbi:MAG: acetylxylan esterase [Candidatus Methanofastidiosum sp.]|nr:acetylxylan esterase [Methanofastidiosum sp.]
MFSNIFPNPLKTKVNLKSKKYRKLESSIPHYIIPDVLLSDSGVRIVDKQTWLLTRRAEIINMLIELMYGRSPFHSIETFYQVCHVNDIALQGNAIRKEIDIKRRDKPDAFFRLMLYYPKQKSSERKFPVFLGLNFYGNHTISKEKDISITRSWISDTSITLVRKPELLRGIDSSAWPLNYLIKNGFAVATAYYEDIVPDRKDGKDLAIRKWFTQAEIREIKLETWGAIDAWAWAIMKAIDYINQDEDLDNSRIVVFGHSRLGKVALWAGALDDRASIVISNNSGCCGASLSKRRFGETIEMINKSQPHWFCDDFKKFNKNERELPFDQHFLIATIAPRPVYIASAQLDLHADPYGEFLAAKFASPVYNLFNLIGLPAEDLAEVNKPIMGTIGYHMRKGPHGIEFFDWQQFIRFADMHFKK